MVIGFGSNDVVFCDSDSEEIVTRKVCKYLLCSCQYFKFLTFYFFIRFHKCTSCTASHKRWDTNVSTRMTGKLSEGTKLRPYNRPILLGHELRVMIHFNQINRFLFLD